MKKLFSLVTCVALLAGVAANAATTIGLNGVPLINSTASTNEVVNFPYWPVAAAGGTSVTNFTMIDISSAKEVSLKFVCQSTNTTTTSNIVWTIYKDLPGSAPTNALGTGLQYSLLGTVTNVLNGVTPSVAIASYSAIPRTTVTPSQSTDAGIAGIGKLYIGYVTIPALSGITNYQVYVNKK